MFVIISQQQTQPNATGHEHDDKDTEKDGCRYCLHFRAVVRVAVRVIVIARKSCGVWQYRVDDYGVEGCLVIRGCCCCRRVVAGVDLLRGPVIGRLSKVGI